MKYLSKQWYRASQGNEKNMKTGLENYWEYFSKVKDGFPDELANLNMHDAKILNDYCEGRNSVILVRSAANKAKICKIRFINPAIIFDDGSLKNKYWKYNEVYTENGKYEFHILASDAIGNLYERIISTDDIVFSYNQTNTKKQLS